MCPPRASIAACNRLGILYMRDSQYSPEISFTHTSLITLTNSEKDLAAFVTLNTSL